VKIVASSFGSAGDFLPTLAVGAALRRRGHEVQFVGNPFYETRVRNAGLGFIPAGEHWDVYDKIEKNPAYADPANTGLLLKIHGGAGRTGEALRCGRPVICVPLAFDQFTLCSWIEKLGVGVRVPVAGRTRSDLRRVLHRVLSDDSMGRRATRAGMRFAEERDGADSAADAIESLDTRRLARDQSGSCPSGKAWPLKG